MGYEVAGAMGIKLAAPERKMQFLVGDGSYMIANSARDGRYATSALHHRADR